MRELIVGTRNSKLALIQTKWVMTQLRLAGVINPIKIKEIVTIGDKRQNVSLLHLGGGGVFLQEIEQELVDGKIDFAVHSLKDIPVQLPEGLMISSVPVREDYRDVLLAVNGKTLAELPAGAVIGTSSIRRSAQLFAVRPDIQTKWIRGPIDSRIKQMQDGKFDAIVLAAAGLNRLGIGQEFITEYLPAESFVPAMGQGALAIECREEDMEIHHLLAKINDKATELAVKTERLFLACFGEEEQAPIGGYAYLADDKIHLHGMVIQLDGKTMLEHKSVGTNPIAVAKEVADVLIKAGAMDIIKEVKQEIQ